MINFVEASLSVYSFDKHLNLLEEFSQQFFSEGRKKLNPKKQSRDKLLKITGERQKITRDNQIK